MKRIILIAIAFLTFSEVNAQGKKTEKATFGMGCFWCTEAIFQRLKGVTSVRSGYEGGRNANPTYAEVCTGTTGHAEVLEISFNPTVISYDELLEVFWKSHDPTTLNRQGADTGTQYRSVVFYHSAAQKALADKYKTSLNKNNVYGKPVVTAIEAAKPFYVAENYHQNYYLKNGSEPYCRMVILPKMQKLEQVFKAKLKN